MTLEAFKIPGSTRILWDNKNGPGSAGNTRRGLTRSPGTSREGLPVMVSTLVPIDDHDPANSAPVINDLDAGIAAEHLVCADLLMGGWRAFMTDQNCPYDIAVEAGGRLIRVQVKATRQARPTPQRTAQIPAYMWHVRRAGKGGKRVYGEDEFDLLALVALDIRKIAYLPPSRHRQTVHIKPPKSQVPGGKRFEDCTLADALAEITSVQSEDLFSRIEGRSA